MNIWATMSQIDIRKFTEKKNGFTYLSWPHALRLLKDHVPNAIVEKHKFPQSDGTLLPMMLDSQGYAYVQVTVHLGDGEAGTTEIMPVLNHANKAIQNPNSFEVNAQIQRCMAKAISMATGLGIHLYAGEDMPAPTSAQSEPVREQVEAPSSFKTPEMSLATKISICPNMDSLKKLHSEVQLGLSADDRQLFTKRKQELANG